MMEDRDDPCQLLRRGTFVGFGNIVTALEFDPIVPDGSIP